MKNSNLFKKFAVMVVSAMMVITSFAMPTFAAATTTLKVNGVDKDSTVKGYQVVEQDENNKWVMKADYGELKDVNIKDPKDETKTITVKAWVVKGTYNETEKTGVIYAYAEKDDEKGLTSFETAPSATALAALAAIAQGKKDADIEFAKPTDSEPAFTAVVEIPENKTEYNHKVGSYLVLAEATNDVSTIYNPMLLSINPEGAGVTQDKNNIVEATVANAKKSDIPFEKVVERNDALDRDNTNANAKNGKVTGDDAKVDADKDATTGTTGLDGNRGDTAPYDENGDGGKVTYRINTMIPNFADNYFMAEEDGTLDEKYSKKVNGKDFYNPKFKVYDTLSDGLDLDGNSIALYEFKKATTDPQVAASATPLAKDNGKTGDEKVEYYTVEPTVTDAEDTFVVSFTPAGIKEYRGKLIEIRYSAAVNDEHGFNFDGEKNTAYPQYTRKPGQNGDGEECKGEEKKTYHYTFTINGAINGDGSWENREVIKVGLDKYDKFVWKETVTSGVDGWKPLEGVVFKLYKKIPGATTAEAYKNAEVVRTATSDAKGILRDMDRIDAGEYVLIEDSLGTNTEYAKNTTPIDLVIEAKLDTYGRLWNYTVEVNGIEVGNYTKTYDDTNGVEEGLATNGSFDEEFWNDATTVLDETKEGIHKVTYNGKTTWDTDDEAADIINTKVGTLPSTGGIGTVVFTVGGIAIMALALFLLFGAKKKEQE